MRTSFISGLLITCMMVVTTGCVQGPTRAAYEQGLMPFIGHHVDTLVRQWGPAHQYHQMTDGTAVYQWGRSRADIYPVVNSLPTGHFDGYYSGYGFGGAWGGYPWGYGASVMSYTPVIVTHECVTRVTTDTQKIIRTIQSDGDDCVAYEKQ